MGFIYGGHIWGSYIGVIWWIYMGVLCGGQIGVIWESYGGSYGYHMGKFYQGHMEVISWSYGSQMRVIGRSYGDHMG